MEAIEPVLAAERRAKRDFAMRMKQFVLSLSTASYALLAASVIEPMFKGQQFGALNVLISSACITALGVSVFVAPWTEVDHGRL